MVPKEIVHPDRTSWTTATGALLILTVSWLYYVYPFTALYIMKTFNVNLTIASLMVSMNSITMSLGSIVVGILMDKYGIKVIGPLSSVITGLFTALVSLSPTIWWAITLFSIAGFFSFPPIAPKVASEWFPEESYGRVMAYIYLGFYIASIMMGPLTAYITSVSSWRTTWLVMGIVSIALGAISYPLLRSRKAIITPQQITRTTLKDILRYKEAWIIFFTAFFHVLPHGNNDGLPHAHPRNNPKA